MGDVEVEHAAQLIWQARRSRSFIPLVSQLHPGLDFDQAIRIQRAHATKGEWAWPPVYKVSKMPRQDGTASQIAIAPLTQAGILSGSGELASPRPYHRAIEAELVVGLNAQGAVTDYALGLEMPLLTFDLEAAAEIEDAIADNLCADRVVVGTTVRKARRDEIDDLTLTVRRDGVLHAQTRIGDRLVWAVIDEALAEIRRSQWPLVDGTRLFSGSLAPPIVSDGEVFVEAACETLGRVSIKCAASGH